MREPGTVVFDIIGTSFSLEQPRQQLLELGAPNYTLELWFSQALRDAFAFSHAGKYKALKEILRAELPRTLKLLEIEVDSAQCDRVMATFSQLNLQPRAKEAFEILTEAGWEIIALTNGSKDATDKLLENAGVKKHFAEVYSCDEITTTKPHPDVYNLVQNSSLENTWLVAAHAWDIAGAIGVGMKTAFVSSLEIDYLEAYPQPQILAKDLLEAARQIINFSY